MHWVAPKQLLGRRARTQSGLEVWLSRPGAHNASRESNSALHLTERRRIAYMAVWGAHCKVKLRRAGQLQYRAPRRFLRRSKTGNRERCMLLDRTSPGRSVLRRAHISYVNEEGCDAWLVIRTRFVLPAFSPNSGSIRRHMGASPWPAHLPSGEHLAHLQPLGRICALKYSVS